MKLFHLSNYRKSLQLVAATFLLLLSSLSFGYLTPAQFDDLEDDGNVDPGEVRFSQDSVSECFSDGGNVDELIDQLRDGDVNVDDIPPIRIVRVNPASVIRPHGSEMAAGVYSLDNRRLYAFKQAGIDVRFTKLDEIPNNQRFKFTSDNNGTDINVRVRRGGCPPRAD